MNRMSSACKGNPQKPNAKLNTTRSSKRCDRYRLTNHGSYERRYKNATCYKCRKVGHLQSKCRADSKSGSVGSSTNSTSQYNARSKARVRYVEEKDDDLSPEFDIGNAEHRDDNAFVVSVFSVSTMPNGIDHAHALTIKVPVTIVAIPIEMDRHRCCSVYYEPRWLL